MNTNIYRNLSTKEVEFRLNEIQSIFPEIQNEVSELRKSLEILYFELDTYKIDLHQKEHVKSVIEKTIELADNSIGIAHQAKKAIANRQKTQSEKTIENAVVFALYCELASSFFNSYDELSILLDVYSTPWKNSAECKKSSDYLKNRLAIEKVNEFNNHKPVTKLTPIIEAFINKSKGQPKPVVSTKKSQTLFDIWCTGEEHYNQVIKRLQQKFRETQSSFLVELDGNLTWDKIPIRSWGAYLAGFIWKCQDNKWIIKQNSSKIYKSIVENTFGIKSTSKSFDDILTNDIDDKFTKIFDVLPKIK
jgi:hypothetical protein